MITTYEYSGYGVSVYISFVSHDVKQIYSQIQSLLREIINHWPLNEKLNRLYPYIWICSALNEPISTEYLIALSSSLIFKYLLSIKRDKRRVIHILLIKRKQIISQPLSFVYSFSLSIGNLVFLRSSSKLFL